eukprot:TRINITY_DN847_c0_g1_i1.p1 TRINITY_DN847_c0_g1~~TRINITY_DN847_c0_g1_i1.p1  ORF type:complete len:398 (+),score=46.34 TRINITY_DN847_c0_g1_i1:1120-2313(+)
MASSEENLVPSSSSLEQSAAPRWSVESIMGRCRCWGKWWFTMIVILSWVILIGLLALGVYCGIQWRSADSEYSTAKKDNDAIISEWKKINGTLDSLNKEIKEKTAELEIEQKTLKELKENYGNMSDSYHKLEEQFGEIKTKLSATIKERDKLKEENGKLQEKNKQTQGQVDHLKKEVEVMEHEVKLSGDEAHVFKLASIAVGGVFAAGAVDSILTHIKLSSVNKQLDKLHPYRAGFHKLAQGFEDYELLRWKHGKSVVRENCFQGTNKNDLSKCLDKSPTITTVNTTDGYKFGAVFFEPWKTDVGNYADEKAFTFSDSLAATTKIKDSAHAMIVDPHRLIQFGEGDIAINLDGKTGTAYGKTYSVPAPYTDTTFYYNGTSYEVGSINIDVISLKQRD